MSKPSPALVVLAALAAAAMLIIPTVSQVADQAMIVAGD